MIENIKSMNRIRLLDGEQAVNMANVNIGREVSICINWSFVCLHAMTIIGKVYSFGGTGVQLVVNRKL